MGASSARVIVFVSAPAGSTKHVVCGHVEEGRSQAVGADVLCYAAVIHVVCRVSRGPLQRVLSRRSAQCGHAERCFLCMGALTGSIEAMGDGWIRHRVTAAARRPRRLRPASDNAVV